MSDLMRKILYYENILEFKEVTKSALQPHEVQYENLCRTCLNVAEPTESVELGEGSGSGLCVMGLDGQLMNVKDLLSIAVDIEVVATERLPTTICKICLNKITTFYYFKLQAVRADTVLRRMLAQLDASKADKDKKTQKQCALDVTVNEADCSTSTINGEEKPRFADISESICESVQESKMSPKREPFEREVLHDVEEVMDDVSEENDETDHTSQLEYNEFKIMEEVQEESIVEENEKFIDLEELVYENEQLDEQQTIEEYVVEDDSTQDAELCSQNTETKEFGCEADEVEEYQSLHTLFKEPTYAEPQRKRSKGLKALLDNLTCTICQATFPLQRMLIAHVQAVHPASKAFKCRLCDQMFSHLQSLSRHMRSHKPKIYKKVCSVCQKSFMRSDDWRRHFRTHTGERPYVCSECGKGFKQACELKEHQTTHQKHRHFECSICGHILQSRNGLYIHKKVHEGVKHHKCPHCEKRFITSGELKSHLNVHYKFKKKVMSKVKGKQ